MCFPPCIASWDALYAESTVYLPSLRGFAARSFLEPKADNLMHVCCASWSALRAALVRSSSRFGPGADDVLWHRATVLADMHRCAALRGLKMFRLPGVRTLVLRLLQYFWLTAFGEPSYTLLVWVFTSSHTIRWQHFNAAIVESNTFCRFDFQNVFRQESPP